MEEDNTTHMLVYKGTGGIASIESATAPLISSSITMHTHCNPDMYRVIRVDCNRTVANKINKFFWLTNKHSIEVTDIEITEYAHPPWLPETAGQYGGYFTVIVKNPTVDFLQDAKCRLPMTKVTVCDKPLFKDAVIDWHVRV
jgi:hypothetical protein